MCRALSDDTRRRRTVREHRALDLDIEDCPVELIEKAWNVTTLLLDRADLAGQLRLVRIRQAYLEELGRRDPATLSLWARQALADPDAPSLLDFDPPTEISTGGSRAQKPY